MIKATLGISKEPFYRDNPALLPQQQEMLEMIKIHAQHGGFSVLIGHPGVGKSVLREALEKLRGRDTVVASMTQTMHTYLNIIKQLAESLQLSAKGKDLEQALIQQAFKEVQANKTIYTVIDEAHLLEMEVLRKLRLLFDRFPKKHNLVLLGQPELMYRLSLTCNEDIKSRISYSKHLLPLNDIELNDFILSELSAVGLGANTLDEAAVQVILRSVQGNLRLCRNLCYGSLVAACMEGQRIVSTRHVNEVLIQPHWRSHEALIKQQVKEAK
jgi:MSHA biogenesis protein MshM